MWRNIVKRSVIGNDANATLRKSFHLDNTGFSEERWIETALPSGVITSAEIYRVGLNSNSNEFMSAVTDAVETTIGVDLNEVSARVINCSCLQHWFCVLHINGIEARHHDGATCHKNISKQKIF